MKKILSFLIVILYSPLLFSQNAAYIFGTVTDSVDNKPLANCSVFINGSSKGTMTDSKGGFILKDISPGKYELVISYVGYVTNVVSFEMKAIPIEIIARMALSPKEMTAVTIEPQIKDGWSQWGKLFIENFIGTNENAKYCSIKNEDAIHFWYSKKKRVLTVRADGPLQIENEALGYIIHYKLEDFTYDFSLRMVVYLGYPFFEEMQTDKKNVIKQWNLNRNRAYKESLLHFLRALYADRFTSEGYSLAMRQKFLNYERQRVNNNGKSTHLHALERLTTLLATA
ncbi:MAG TPA: carboxypeptidase-like regulatory domain-containing protein [Puia sp.]|nr:carboxypeptidase-like regulatory domain-containing protein [Puia sp.]